MTSPDGTSWTGHSVATVTLGCANSAWNNVCWSPTVGLFVACGFTTGGANTIWTSPDGVTWTGRGAPITGAAGCDWSPTLGLFVVAGGHIGAGTTVVTSPDGITWTARTTPWDASAHGAIQWGCRWLSGPAVFVVDGAFPGDGSVAITAWVMWSADGITWTNATTATDQVEWQQLSDWSTQFGLALARSNGVSNLWAHSVDGKTWTSFLGTSGPGHAHGRIVIAEGIYGAIFIIPGVASNTLCGQYFDSAITSPFVSGASGAYAACYSPDLDVVVLGLAAPDTSHHLMYSSIPAIVGAIGAGTCATATLLGEFLPGTFSTSLTWFFEWGTSTSYGNVTPGGSVGGLDDEIVTDTIGGGLVPGTTYHVRITVIDSLGVAHHSGDSTWVQGACVDKPTVNSWFDLSTSG